jgi:hypothetical protein
MNYVDCQEYYAKASKRSVNYENIIPDFHGAGHISSILDTFVFFKYQRSIVEYLNDFFCSQDTLFEKS